VDHGLQAAVAADGEADALARLGAERRDGEPLTARRLQADRPADHLRGERHERRSLAEAAADPERAARLRREESNIRGVEPELLRQRDPAAVDVLARLPDGQLVTVPGAGRGEQLHRVVVVGRRGVPVVDRDRSCGKRRLGVSGARQLPRTPVAGADALECGDRRLPVVIGAQPQRAFARALERIRDDHGDDLAVVVHAIAGERRDGRAHVAAAGGAGARLDAVANVAPRQDLEDPRDRAIALVTREACAEARPPSWSAP
jgi:hypothetical protein